MNGISRKTFQGAIHSSTGNSPPNESEILKPSETGIHLVTDIVQESFCPENATFQLQVVDKRELRNNAFEFTFKQGNETVRGISFGNNGGPANNNLLQTGYTYHVKALYGKIEIRLRNELYPQPSFTSKYELRLPELYRLSATKDKSPEDSKSILNTISELNQLIDSAGEFYRQENLTNVAITHCEFRRYKGCHICKTQIQDPIHDNQRLLCQKCQWGGGNTMEDRKWEMFMTLRDCCFTDDEGNSLQGGIAFHDECKEILAHFCENYDEMFDEDVNDVTRKNLIGAKVDVSIKIYRQKYLSTGQSSTNVKIVVSRLKILSQPPASDNGIPVETEPLPSASSGRNGYATTKPSNFEDVEQADEECAGEADYNVTHDSHSTRTVTPRHQHRTVFVQSGTNSVSIGQPDQSLQSDSDSPSDLEPHKPKQNYDMKTFPDIDELEEGVDFNQTFHLERCGVMILNIFTTEVDGKIHERPGSEKDVENLEQLFRNTLDVRFFKTFKNVKSTRLSKRLKDFENFLKEINADSMMLFFSCHGTQNSIIMSDGVRINIYTILARYSDDVFPQLAGKPKMFFDLSCQKFDRKINSKCNGFLVSQYSATLISLAQLSGNVVKRWPDIGTPFVHYFCEVVRKHSDEKDVMQLLNLTSRGVQQLCKEIREQNPELRGTVPNQVPQVQTIDFHTKYYFKKRHKYTSDSFFPKIAQIFLSFLTKNAINLFKRIVPFKEKSG